MDNLRDMRISKMAALPYLYPNATTEAVNQFNCNAIIADIKQRQFYIDNNIPVQFRGRVYAKRGGGKIMFLDVVDESGKIQVFLETSTLGDESYENIKSTIDLGDIVEGEGLLFMTPAGEPTIKAGSLVILAKCINPPPIGKSHDGKVSFALSDEEQQQRQRYLHFISNPAAKAAFKHRSAIIRRIRSILEWSDFMEVETPVLQPLRGGALAKPFITHHNKLDQEMFLRIAPELYLKRLLVGGFERIYEIGRNFRNEGIDTTHNPEFTMLEAYWAYANYEDTMLLVETMFIELCREPYSVVQCRSAFSRIKYFEAFDRVFDAARTDDEGWQEVPSFAEVFGMSEPRRSELIHFVAKHLNIEVSEDATFIQVVDTLFKKCIVKGTMFGTDPFFIVDYPVEISPLAKCCEDNPMLVERYQLIFGGLEIANGYSELADPSVQRERFEAQSQKAQMGDEEAMPIDEDFIEALGFAMPPSSGVGIGIDRLVMLLLGKENIREVILFPTLKAMKGECNEL